MKVKARIGFAGPSINMRPDEIREVKKTECIMDLVSCGYLEVLQDDEPSQIEEPKQEDAVPELVLESLKKSELIGIAKAKGIETLKGDTKEDIIQKLNDAEKAGETLEKEKAREDGTDEDQ